MSEINTTIPYEQESFSMYKRRAIKAAEQLLYSEEVISKIKQAKDIPSIARILHGTRLGS